MAAVDSSTSLPPAPLLNLVVRRKLADIRGLESMRPLALRIASLQYAFVWEMNDIHIFLRQALPLLAEAKTKYSGSDHKKDRRYYVPAVGRTKFARRKDSELKEVYDRFTAKGLYEAFLVSAVSQFESFLMDVLALVITEYQGKLGVSVPGVSACKQAGIDALLESSTIEEARERVISDHLSGVFYATPRAYLDYVGKIAG